MLGCRSLLEDVLCRELYTIHSTEGELILSRPKLAEEVSKLVLCAWSHVNSLTETLAVQLKFAIREVPGLRSASSTVPTTTAAIANAFPREYLGPGQDYIVPSSGFFFSSPSTKASLMKHMPSKSAADRLVNQYWAAVYRIARVLYRPSFERQYSRFWDQISSGIEPPTSFRALLLAIMLSAAISMSEEDTLNNFNMKKPEVVNNLRQGTEAALSKAHFLRSTKLETLQAFVAYLVR